MRVIVTAQLDDGTTMSVPVNVNAGGNAAFWASGVIKGANLATKMVADMVISLHGGKAGGVHIITDDNGNVVKTPMVVPDAH